MKILITGAAGFIGSNVAKALLAQGETVVGLDDFNDFYDPALKRANAAELANHDNFRMIEGDLRDAATCLSAVEGCDVVCHLAARAGVRPSLEQPALYMQTNVTGTVNILDAMRQHDIKKLVHASSSSVYGGNKKVPFAEADPVENPWSPYAASKRSNELALWTWHHLYELQVYALRFFTVFGPGQRPDLAIQKFIRRIDADETIPVFGDGESARDYTFIDDIVAGVVAAIDRVNGYEIINLGGDEPVKLSEMISTIETALDKPARIDRQPVQPGDVPRTMADIGKARRLLDYDPKTSFREGVERQVAWVRASQ